MSIFPDSYKEQTLNQSDVKGNFSGGLENILCSYCDTGTETQIHIMQECPHFIDLTRELDLTKLDENQNLEFKKKANILCQITDRLKKPYNSQN